MVAAAAATSSSLQQNARTGKLNGGGGRGHIIKLAAKRKNGEAEWWRRPRPPRKGNAVAGIGASTSMVPAAAAAEKGKRGRKHWGVNLHGAAAAATSTSLRRCGVSVEALLWRRRRLHKQACGIAAIIQYIRILDIRILNIRILNIRLFEYSNMQYSNIAYLNIQYSNIEY